MTTAPAAALVPAAAAAVTAPADNYAPGPLLPGYMRLEAAPVDVAAGSSEDWAQWVGGPLDQDYDVMDITGSQGVAGHHALLYATAEAHPAGYTRLWTDADQETSRLMGGVGGEGGASSKLPPGVVFRVKKGSYLLLQTHYLNTRDSAVKGRAYVDIKLAPVDTTRTVASIFANVDTHVILAPMSAPQMDVSCPVGVDLQFIQISNHMHEYGTHTYTEYVDPSGVHHMLKEDKIWYGDLALNPDFTDYPVSAPLVIPKGSTLHTHCEWSNSTTKSIEFPAEMCVFFGFILSDHDVTCSGGKWPVGLPAKSSTIPPSAGMGAAAAASCAGAQDMQQLMRSDREDLTTSCTTQCAFDPDVSACVAPCLESQLQITSGCAACQADVVACGVSHCRSDCALDSAGAPCRTCVMTHCKMLSDHCNSGP